MVIHSRQNFLITGTREKKMLIKSRTHEPAKERAAGGDYYFVIASSPALHPTGSRNPRNN